jgi:predicted regulator of Ras-like GTPase activity (Roadblock/LC7/MglB family)
MLENRKLNLYTVGIFVVLLIGMFVWKNLAVKNMEKKMEAQRVKVVEKSQHVITSNTHDLLRLTTIPLVWAVRKEMINENYDQINEYLNRFIKEPNIKQILVVKSDGTIAVATDKKLEGAPFSSIFPQDLIEQNEISISDDEKGNIRIVAPIMGLNAKLGLLIMIYEPEKINIEVAP